MILLCAMFMPTSPRKMLIAALVAASMRPIGVWLAYLRGVDVPSLAQTLALSVPAYACAFIATLPSRMFQRMGQRLKEARELGNYQLVEKLGQGGMGEVWRARHRLLAREAAIKLVRPEMLGTADESAARQLLRAVRTRGADHRDAHLAEHDSALRFRDCRRRLFLLRDGAADRPRPRIARPAVRSDARRARDVPAAAGVSLAGGGARARPGASRREARQHLRLPHGPRLSTSSRCSTSAWSSCISSRAATEETRSLLTMQQVVGTPSYMAPEVILASGNADARADVYALGCVAYFLLTRKRVFDDASPMQALDRSRAQQTGAAIHPDHVDHPARGRRARACVPREGSGQPPAARW